MSADERHFIATLTDPQIEALEKACSRFLDDAADWSVNAPTRDELNELGGALAALQNAEIDLG